MSETLFFTVIAYQLYERFITNRKDNSGWYVSGFLSGSSFRVSPAEGGFDPKEAPLLRLLSEVMVLYFIFLTQYMIN